MRFYLHQRIGNKIIEDPDGIDCPSIAAARASAITAARHLWAAAIVDGEDLTGETIEIADEAGRLLMSVPLTDALPPQLALAASRTPEFGQPLAVPA